MRAVGELLSGGVVDEFSMWSCLLGGRLLQRRPEGGPDLAGTPGVGLDQLAVPQVTIRRAGGRLGRIAGGQAMAEKVGMHIRIGAWTRPRAASWREPRSPAAPRVEGSGRTGLACPTPSRKHPTNQPGTRAGLGRRA
jgi:hypothetical protein